MKSAPDTHPTFPAADVRSRMTEREFQQWVTDLMQLRGWRWYHTHDSRRSPGGFPDLVACRNGQLIFAELKRDTGAVSDTQQMWLDDLREVEMDSLHYGSSNVWVFLWRPYQMEEIWEVLR